MGRKEEPKITIVPTDLIPEARFTPGSIVLYIPEYLYGDTHLAPHYLSRENAEKIRDELSRALEDEAAVSAVLSHTDMRRPSCD